MIRIELCKNTETFFLKAGKLSIFAMGAGTTLESHIATISWNNKTIYRTEIMKGSWIPLTMKAKIITFWRAISPFKVYYKVFRNDCDGVKWIEYHEFKNHREASQCIDEIESSSDGYNFWYSISKKDYIAGKAEQFLLRGF